MTLTDYYTSVDDKYPTLSTLDTTFVYRAINRARKKVAQETDATLYISSFPFVAGTQAYAFPVVSSSQMTSFLEVTYFLGNLRTPPLERAPAGFRPLLALQGWPYWWWPLNQQINFYPIPSMAYTCEIKGKLDPYDLAAGVAESLIPPPYQEAVAYKACVHCAMKDGNADLIKGFEELYRLELLTVPRGKM